MMRKLAGIILCILFSGLMSVILAQENSGTVSGTVRDTETQAPLIGVNVIVEGSDAGSATDSLGRYVITDLSPGSYSVRFNYIGYHPLIKTDVIIRPARITSLDVSMEMQAIQSQIVEVRADYFAPTTDQPTDKVNFSNEEIRRTPGAAGDVSRIMMMLPSVAKINDQVNSLIVRGGSPSENAFFVDNIPIPNINHFPTQGTSSGAIGLLNVDFIKDVNFYTGGFPVMYGDKLSSAMDIKFRQGNRSEFDGQIDMGFAGFGGIGEGPISEGEGSWMLSVRRSYLDVLLNMLDFAVTPMYSDAQGKVVYDINPQQRVSILDIFGMDKNKITKETAIKDQDISAYGSDDHYENTLGANWRALWDKSSYSETSLSQSFGIFKRNFIEYDTDMPVIHLDSREIAYTLRNENHIRFNPQHSIEFGFEGKILNYNYNNIYGEYADALGNPTPEIHVTSDIRAAQSALFVNYIIRAIPQLKINLGLRGNYFSYTNNHSLEPRCSFSYHLTEMTSITGSTGLYVQNIPMNLLAQMPGNKKLHSLQAVHYILGIEHLLTNDTRLTIEGYKKLYSYFPVDPQQPSLFTIDEIFYRDGYYMGHAQLTDAGRAESHGLEVMLQKKLARNFYGVISGSYFHARYRDLNGIWRPRVIENRYLATIEGGYKPNNRWEISGRWVYAGGRPYTPCDIEASKAANRAILDSSRINGARYPAYHSLNIRIDRRFWFQTRNITVYISLWNTYNQQNVARYFWNKVQNKKDVEYQWSLLPIFGIEYEF